jgi:4-hydroxybenzoate polyprenyltransferase
MTRLASIAGLVRLGHPFPSLLCASATTVIAALAGAVPETAARLGVAMLAMQVSIGALNDVVDAPVDAREKSGKPIPSGIVSRRLAWVVAVGGALIGIGLSSVSSPAVAVVALAGLGLGYAYDAWLSRTYLSWLPLALALPLLPIHAWLGAAGTIPIGLLTLVPAAVLGGLGLALANGLADLDRDRGAARGTAVVALGPRRTWAVQTTALAVAAALAVFVAPSVPGTGGGAGIDSLRLVRYLGVGLGLAGLATGALALASRSAHVRERGWELEAAGVASLGVGWLAGTAAAAVHGGAGV